MLIDQLKRMSFFAWISVNGPQRVIYKVCFLPEIWGLSTHFPPRKQECSKGRPSKMHQHEMCQKYEADSNECSIAGAQVVTRLELLWGPFTSVIRYMFCLKESQPRRQLVLTCSSLLHCPSQNIFSLGHTMLVTRTFLFALGAALSFPHVALAGLVQKPGLAVPSAASQYKDSVKKVFTDSYSVYKWVLLLILLYWTLTFLVCFFKDNMPGDMMMCLPSAIVSTLLLVILLVNATANVPS